MTFTTDHLVCYKKSLINGSFSSAAYTSCTEVTVLSDATRHTDSTSSAKLRDQNLQPNKWYKFEGPNGAPRQVGPMEAVFTIMCQPSSVIVNQVVCVYISTCACVICNVYLYVFVCMCL